MTPTRRPAVSRAAVIVVAAVTPVVLVFGGYFLLAPRGTGADPAGDAGPKTFPAAASEAGAAAERHSLQLPGGGPALGRMMPTGARAVVARGSTAWLVDLADRSRMATFSGHKSPITSMAVSADGNTLLTGSRDGTARLWDAATGKRRFQLLFRGAVRGVALAADGRATLISEEVAETREGKSVGKNAVHLYDAKTGKAMNHLDFPAPSEVAVSNDGERAIASNDRDVLMVWPLSIRPNPDPGKRPELPGRSVLAPTGPRDVILGGSDGRLLSWDTEDMKLLRTFAGHGSAVRDITVPRPDGAFYSVSGGADNSLRAWNLARRESSGRIVLPSPGATVSVSASGKLVLTTEESGAVRVFAAEAIR